MSVKLFKNSFNICYLVDIYKEYKTYYNFDFYPVTDLNDLISSVGSLESIKSEISKERVEPLFSFCIKNTPKTLIFYTDEMPWLEKISSTTLNEASEFCHNYWLENYEKSS